MCVWYILYIIKTKWKLWGLKSQYWHHSDFSPDSLWKQSKNKETRFFSNCDSKTELIRKRCPSVHSNRDRAGRRKASAQREPVQQHQPHTVSQQHTAHPQEGQRGGQEHVWELQQRRSMSCQLYRIWGRLTSILSQSVVLSRLITSKGSKKCYEMRKKSNVRFCHLFTFY